VLWLFISIMRLMVGRGCGMIGWGMVDNSMMYWGMDSMMDSMVNRGMNSVVNWSMVNDRSMDSMVNKWGMDSMVSNWSMYSSWSMGYKWTASKCCEWNSCIRRH